MSEAEPAKSPYAIGSAEYASRVAKLRDAMAGQGVDVAVITAPDTMAWLTGFRSRWYRQHTATSMPPTQCTIVHVTDGDPFMIEAGYHEELVRDTSTVTDIRLLPTTEFHEASLDDYVAFLAEQLSPWGGGVVGLERWSCIPSPAVSDRVEAVIRSLGCTVADVSLPFRAIRRLKSAAEIAAIEAAQHACDAGIEAIFAEATPQTTGLEAWGIFSLGMARAGGEPAALHETVAVGNSIASIHQLSSREQLGSGPYFHPDMAAAVEGYHARATRPIVFGAADRRTTELAGVAAGAYEVILEYGQVGTPWSDLLGRLRAYWEASGVNGGCAGYELGISIAPSDWVGEFVWGMHDDLDGVIEAGLVTNFETWNDVILVDTVVFEHAGPRFLSRLPRTVLEIA